MTRPRVIALVFGGRHFGLGKPAQPGDDETEAQRAALLAVAEAQRQALYRVLDDLRPHLVVQGGASGADGLAGAWAWENKVAGWTLDAPWAVLGRAAGPARNETMLRAVLHLAAQCSRRGVVVELVAVQCPGDRGTADMRERVVLAVVRLLPPGS